MKIWSRIVIIFVCIMLVSSASGMKMKYINKPLKKVFKKAQKKNKPIFVDVYADWCGPCKMMDKEVFSRKDVAEFMNDNFINFKMDIDNETFIYEKFEYDITKLPTLLFLTPEGKLIKKFVGSTTGSSLLSMARKALKPQDI